MITCENNVFHLKTELYSYLFCVDKYGMLQHLHFGTPVHTEDAAAFIPHPGLGWGSCTLLDDADSAASAGSAEDAPGQEDGEQNKPRKKHRLWIPILLILLLIGAAAGGYMYGVFYFRDRFIYNTKINGVVCGRLTPAETAERIGFRMEKRV